MFKKEQKNLINIKSVVANGDTHGLFDAWHKLASNIRAMIPGSVLLHCGDWGAGFRNVKVEEAMQDGLNVLCCEHDVMIFVIRGNHDSKKRMEEYKNFSNIKFLDDYTYFKINGAKFGFVGGAISIDRSERVPGLSYWEDEVFVLDSSKIQKCDVLITHSGPPYIGPCDKNGIKHFCDKDPTLWDECKRERKDHETLIKLSGSTHHRQGHLHCSCVTEKYGCESRILDIDEAREIFI